MNYKKLIAVCFFMVFLAMVCYPQDSIKIGNSYEAISESKNDTDKYQSYIDLARLYSGNNEEQAYIYLNKALAVAVKINQRKYLARAVYLMGSHYFRVAEYTNAIAYFIKAAELFSETKNDNGLASVYNNIGNVYINMEEYDHALKYEHKALEIQLKLKSGRANTLNSIGNIFRLRGNLDSARHYFESALEIEKNPNNEIPHARTLNYLGLLSENSKDTTEALKYFEMSEKIYEDRYYNNGIATNKNLIGDIYLHKKEYQTASNYFKEALEMAQLAEAREEEEKAYKGLATTFENLHQYADAYKYIKQYYEIQDSLFNTGKQQLTTLQYNMEAQQNENLIAVQKSELEKNNIRIEKQHLEVYALAGGVFLLIALTILAFYSYNRKKSDNEIIKIEKQKSEELLLNILPSEVAEELKLNGRSQARKIELVTVLFADFKGFSKYAANLEPEVLVEQLDYYFRSFDAIIGNYDIEKIKTIGDSYMCAGGLPDANSTNPVDVVNCGLMMRDFVEEYKKSQIAIGGQYLEMRIGIHTGPVVAGIVGLKKFSYDIWGDTVNIASRIESAGHEGKVNLSDVTYQYVKDHFRCEYRGKIPIKNRGEIEMYFAEPL
ncbi:MAG: adenylate/guanylate cyclase domain-containing protein [Bacteroidales bacterium]|jgi:class 3 adenylate cyclase